MHSRHEVLFETIGYLDEEKHALDNGFLILCFSFSYIGFGAIAETILFSLYNSKFHPFASILQDDLAEGIFYGTSLLIIVKLVVILSCILLNSIIYV